jgi:hypothetical protein
MSESEIQFFLFAGPALFLYVVWAIDGINRLIKEKR